MYVRWLDEIEDFRFDVTLLPGAHNPTDPLSRLGFTDGDGPATLTGEPDAESQEELCSRLGRDAPAPAVLAVVSARWATTSRAAAVAFANVQGGDAIPPTNPPLRLLGGPERRRRRVRAHVPDVQRTTAEHGDPRVLLHPLPLPSLRGGMIGVDWIAGLLTMAAGFNMIQNHVDMLSGKVHAVPTRSTAMATDAAAIIRDMCLRSGAGFPDVLVVDHDAKFTSEVFRAFVKSMGSCLIVGSAYHKNTNAKVERANGVISDTLHAYANGRKDDWDSHLTLAEFAINNAASTLGENLLHRSRSAPSPPALSATRRPHCGESPAHYAQRMSSAVREAHYAQRSAGAARGGAGGAEGKTRRGPGRHGVQGGRPGAAADQGAARRRRHR